MNPKPRGVRSIDEHVVHMREQQRLDTQAPSVTRCPTHQQRIPCGACSGDHRAGDHKGETVTSCPRCEPSPRPVSDVVDVRALAAGEHVATRPLSAVPSPAADSGRADVVELEAARRRHPAGKVGARPAATVDDAVRVPVLHVPLRDDVAEPIGGAS